jgi:hypothetical protein
MFKTIRVDHESNTHILETEVKPDKSQVSFFSGSYTDPVPVIFESAADRAKWKDWIQSSELQIALFEQYFKD